MNNNNDKIKLANNQNSKELKELTHKLTERVKELNCLYGISRLVETTDLSLEDLLQGAVNLIPPAWQYPDITCARIQFKDKQIVTDNFRVTRWKQDEPININGNPSAKIEVFYLKKKPSACEGPFLKEERLLIHAIAERLGHIIERKLSDNALQAHYDKEKELREQLEEEINNRIDYTRKLIHELKTPLTSLLATSQLLHEEMHDGKLSRLSQYVWQNACNLNNRIDELHDTIKGEIGKLNLNYKALNLKKLIISIAQETEILAQQCNMKMVLDIAPDLHRVHADEVRVKQILLNLLNNAFKYARDSSLVRISAIPNNNMVIIEVHDEGPGIKDDDQKRIFDPYYSSPHKVQHTAGLGIGLSLCKVIVEAHGGKIWVESKTGKGTSFFFTLQRYPPENKTNKKVTKVRR